MAKTLVVNGIHQLYCTGGYIPPKSAAVREHLEWFMDQKLGLMMHWAPGCQLGTYESWPLSDGDGSWSQEDMTWGRHRDLASSSTGMQTGLSIP